VLHLGHQNAVHIEHTGANGHRAARVADRFGCIHDQIHHELPELGGVGLDQRRVFAKSNSSATFLEIDAFTSSAMSRTISGRLTATTSKRPLPE
jgi:hypothetical protein